MTYTIIMVIIAQFFSSSNTSVSEVITAMTKDDIFSVSLSSENFATLTLASILVLVFIIKFLTNQIPQVTKMILSVFDLDTNTKLSDELGDNAMKLTSSIVNSVKEFGKTAISGGNATGGN